MTREYFWCWFDLKMYPANSWRIRPKFYQNAISEFWVAWQNLPNVKNFSKIPENGMMENMKMGRVKATDVRALFEISNNLLTTSFTKFIFTSNFT